MANVPTPCGLTMTMAEFVHHISRCMRCAVYFQRRRGH